MKINIIKGVKKRESCFFYRRDTVKGVYRMPVCEKNNFRKPSLSRCNMCTLYTPYLSMSELADREKNRYKNFLKVPKQVSCNICGQKIMTNNPAIKQCRDNCGTLLNFIKQNEESKKVEESLPKSIKNVQKKLVQKSINFI